MKWDFYLNPTIDFDAVPEQSLRDITRLWVTMGLIETEELLSEEEPGTEIGQPRSLIRMARGLMVRHNSW